MRSVDVTQAVIFSYRTLEKRIPARMLTEERGCYPRVEFNGGNLNKGTHALITEPQDRGLNPAEIGFPGAAKASKCKNHRRQRLIAEGEGVNLTSY